MDLRDRKLAPVEWKQVCDMSHAVRGDRRGGWLDDEDASACKELALWGLRGTV